MIVIMPISDSLFHARFIFSAFCLFPIIQTKLIEIRSIIFTLVSIWIYCPDQKKWIFNWCNKLLFFSPL